MRNSPDSSIARLRPALPALTAALLAATVVQAAEPPRLQFVAGDVKVLRVDGTQVAARKGDVLNLGDRLLTGPGGNAQIRAADQGVVAVRPASDVEFKPQALGLGVVLNQGQLRAVSDLGGVQPKGFLQVITPDSKIGVDAGDIETGIQPVAGGGETFSKVHTGDVTLNPDAGDAAKLAPGDSFKTAGDLQLKVDALPVAMTQPVELPPLPDTPGRPLPETVVALPMPGGPVSVPALPVPGDLGAKLPLQIAALDVPKLAPLGGANVANLPFVKVPEVRVEPTAATIKGAEGFSVPIISAVRVGGDDPTLTPTKAILPVKRPPVVFEPITEVINNKPLPALAPPGKATIVTGAVQVTKVVVVAPAEVPLLNNNVASNIVTPTVAVKPVVNNTVLTPITSKVVDTSTLNINTVLKPTATNLSSGFSFGGIRK